MGSPRPSLRWEAGGDLAGGAPAAGLEGGGEALLGPGGDCPARRRERSGTPGCLPGKLRDAASPRGRLVEDDDGAELLSLRHDGERVLDLGEVNPPRHHLVQMQAAVAVPVGEELEVARAEAVAVPAGLDPAPLVPEDAHRQRQLGIARRYPDQDRGPEVIAALERAAHRLRPCDDVQAVVDAVAAGQL